MSSVAVFFPAGLRVGIFNQKEYILLFTIDELALVRISDAKRRELIENALKNSSGGYFAKVKVMSTALHAYADQLKDLPLERVVSEHVDSILIHNEDIVQISVIQKNLTDDGRDYSSEIRIQTVKEKYHFVMEQLTDIVAVKNGLGGIFGKRLKT